MTLQVSSAMILAAGLGTRMRPLTLTTPKPLIEVGGKCLIDYGVDRLRDDGVTRLVVNAHFLPSQIESWAARQVSPKVVISDERDEILDTGGGIRKALPLLGNSPFFVLNSDSFWLDRGEPALQRLREAWNDSRMDCLLLLSRLNPAIGYDGPGDFDLLPGGQLQRRAGRGEALAYMGAYLVHPRLFAGVQEKKFSMNVLWNKAISTRRLHGLVHRGLWLHVGTPEAIAAAEAAMDGP